MAVTVAGPFTLIDPIRIVPSSLYPDPYFAGGGQRRNFQLAGRTFTAPNNTVTIPADANGAFLTERCIGV